MSDARPTLAAPVSRGFAVGLVALNLVALGWLWGQQEQRLASLEHQIGTISYPAPSTGGLDSTDPELCWLLGVIADAQGKGQVVAGMASGADTVTACQTYAMRGARGQNSSGN